MSRRLEGKTSVITGAAAGIGAAAAHRFHEEGAMVFLMDRDRHALASVVGQLPGSVGLDGDLTERDVVDDLFAAVRDHGHQPIHVLLNCVGGSAADDAPIDELRPEVLSRTLRLDLESMINSSAAAMPSLRAAEGASVINLTSYAAFHGTTRIHAYVAAKGAVAALTRSMAGTYARDLIRVNAIAPAAALSERAKGRLQDPNVSASLTFDWADYPFAMGPPKDIANIALFLASDESRMLTGQIIMADGGITAY